MCIAMSSACTTVGSKALKSENNETISSKIIEGETKKIEVLRTLGAPSVTTFTDSGLEIMTYEHTRFTPKWYNFIPYNLVHLKEEGNKKELVILYDESSVVKRVAMNEAQVERTFGITQ